MSRTLLISVRFLDGRYHGAGDWPPSPARLFQAMVAGAARGGTLGAEATAALGWLETLPPPVIAAPRKRIGQGVTSFVPNNDLDAVGGDPARIGEIRTGKTSRPAHFDAALAFDYLWTYEPEPDAEMQAAAVVGLAAGLYQLGRGVDMAFACGELLDDEGARARLTLPGRTVSRPSRGGGGAPMLPCPFPGSLASLTARFEASRGRFKTVGSGRKARLQFTQPPKPRFAQIAYDSPHALLLFDIRAADDDGFAGQPPERIVGLVEALRDRVIERLGQRLPEDVALIERCLRGRGATEADKAQRVHIVPLPSIGSSHVTQLVRRVLVDVPPDCPIAADHIAWAFSGLPLQVDAETGEIDPQSPFLVAADDDSMLEHYGIGDRRAARLWRSVTPVALSESAARRRIDPERTRAEAKGGAERSAEEARAVASVQQALRHAGIAVPATGIAVRREPFSGRGHRAEAFAAPPRFGKHRLWHVEVALSDPVQGPLVLGDGRYLGLGLMARVRHEGLDGIIAFDVIGGLQPGADAAQLTRAFRRAVMARVQAMLGSRTALPPFFSGHEANGGRLRSGEHGHLAFAWDATLCRLLVVAPHLLERRPAKNGERADLALLGRALDGLTELRAGAAGRLVLRPSPVDTAADVLFGASTIWQSATPYRVTRHAKLADAAGALAADLAIECARNRLPRPNIEVIETFARPGLGLFGRARLNFKAAVAGPLLLGRDRHFGGGLFTSTG
jgi:CRISPR-associated protein Csb2